MSKGGSKSGPPRAVIEAWQDNLNQARQVADDMYAQPIAGAHGNHHMANRMLMQNAFGPGAQNVGNAASMAGRLGMAAAGGNYNPMMLQGVGAGPAAQFGGASAGPAAQFGGASAGPAATAEAADLGPVSTFQGAQAGPVSTFQGASAGPAAQFGGAAANRGDIRSVMGETMPGQGMGAYMNPYTDQVIDRSMQDLDRARTMTMQGIGDQAARAGAFGGSRHGVAEGEAHRGFADAAASMAGGLRHQGFDTASGLMQQDMNRSLQAGMANQGYDAQAAMLNPQLAQQAGLANMGALNQMGQFNAGNLQQAGLSNQLAQNQGAQFDASNAQQAGLANMGAFNQSAHLDSAQRQQAALANQGAVNNMSQFNAGNMQQAGLANMGALNQMGQFNAGNMQQAGLANMGAMNQMGQFNAGQMQQANLANQQAGIAGMELGLQGMNLGLTGANMMGGLGAQQFDMGQQSAQGIAGMGDFFRGINQQRSDAQWMLPQQQQAMRNDAIGLAPGAPNSVTKPDTMGQLIGAGGAALGGFFMSDRRLKENIVEFGLEPMTGLPWYEFSYLGNPRRFRGVMADDVELVAPGAVHTRGDGYKAVDYGALGIDMVEVAR